MGHLLEDVSMKAKEGKYTTYSTELVCIAQLLDMGDFADYLGRQATWSEKLWNNFHAGAANEANEKNMRMFCNDMANNISRHAKLGAF